MGEHKESEHRSWTEEDWGNFVFSLLYLSSFNFKHTLPHILTDLSPADNSCTEKDSLVELYGISPSDMITSQLV